MQSTITLRKGGYLYAVDFDSNLGHALHEYFTKSAEVRQAAVSFVEQLLAPYMADIIAATPEGHAPYSFDFPDDCDAGGVLVISLPRKNGECEYDDEQKPIAPDEYILPYLLYDAIPDPIEPGARVCYFPRMRRRTRYIRFGQAVRLAADGNPAWEFDTIGKPRRDGRSNLRCFHYGDKEVRSFMTSWDKAKLCDRKGNPPCDAVRLARGVEYFLEFSDCDDNDITDKVLSELPDVKEVIIKAKEAYNAWNKLPVIASGSLMNKLSFNVSATFPDGIKHRCELINATYCNHFIDAANHRYLFYTGLKSIEPDMQIITDDAELEYFKQSIGKA